MCRCATSRLADRHLINLVYTIEQGKRLYVERIEIHGNTKTHDDVIRREFDFGEGDAYNRALVDRAERRLKALGYFKSVKIDTQARLGARSRRPRRRARGATDRQFLHLRRLFHDRRLAGRRSASATGISSAPATSPRRR